MKKRDKNPKNIVVDNKKIRIYSVDSLIVIDPKRQRRRKKYFGGRDWTFVFPAFWECVRKFRLHQSEFLVLSYLIERMEWDEGAISGYSQRRIGEAVGLTQEAVARALKRLEERALIRKRRDGLNVYYVNPFLAWRGSDEAWREAIRTWPDPTRRIWPGGDREG